MTQQIRMVDERMEDIRWDEENRRFRSFKIEISTESVNASVKPGVKTESPEDGCSLDAWGKE